MEIGLFFPKAENDTYLMLHFLRKIFCSRNDYVVYNLWFLGTGYRNYVPQ